MAVVKEFNALQNQSAQRRSLRKNLCFSIGFVVSFLEDTRAVFIYNDFEEVDKDIQKATNGGHCQMLLVVDIKLVYIFLFLQTIPSSDCVKN